MKLLNNSTLESSLHPICLLSSTDTPTFSLYYSFFLLSPEHLQDDNAIVFRIPAERDRLNDVESAVKYFVSISTAIQQNDSFGSFVITTSDGSRYFAVWRGSSSYILVAVSVFPLLSFTRNVFTLIGEEPKETISLILTTLCEYPIIGVPSLSYDIRLYSGTLTLQFDHLGLVEDDDVALIASRLFTPQLLYDSWEALILEHKVLVISSVSSIVPHCCEFLRRLVLPLVVINTYVPFLSEELLSTIEAPFPYLVGAKSEHVYNSRVDISDTYVVDLDQRRVIPPSGTAAAIRLPQSIRTKIIQEINDIRTSPLEQYIQRPFERKVSDGIFVDRLSSSHQSKAKNTNMRDSHSISRHSAMISKTVKFEEHSIIECFVRLNLALFGARYCDIRAFYRRCDRVYAEEGSEASRGFCLPKYKGPDGKNAPMGFSRRNGVICGCMQLLNERKDIHLLQFLPCWVEFDDVVFSVYQFADELPLIFILNKDIVAVSPAPVEPEGHVFDIQVTNQITFRFAATDLESRREWIQEIDRISTKSAPSISPLSIQISSTPDIECVSESNHSVIHDEELALSRFRTRVVQTQMLSYFKTKSEFQDYETILNDLSLSALDLTTSSEDIIPSQVISSSAKRAAETSASRQSFLKRRSSKHLGEVETLHPDEVILNLKWLWGIYISSETEILDDCFCAHENAPSTLSAECNKLLEVPLECHQSALNFLSAGPRDYSSLERLHQMCLQLDNAEKLLISKRDTSWTKNFFKSYSEQESSLPPEIASIKEELKKAIKCELNFRESAAELLQRISATHRQCETDLRKLLIQTKMQTLANLIDINDPSSDKHATVLVDVEEVVLALQRNMSVDQQSFRQRHSCSSLTWEETLRSWGTTQGLQRHTSLEKITFDQTRNSMFSPTQISLEDELSILLDTPNVESFDDIVPVVGGLERTDSNSNSMRPVKQVYQSPEAESIRLAIRRNIEKQLNDCSTDDAPNYLKVLIPVLQGMNGFICGRLPSEDRSAILAYAESALGDQVRIMRCLVRIFLDYQQEGRETADGELHSESGILSSITIPCCRNLVTSAHVENFLCWAYSVSDIIGLQSVRLITELLHRSLCARMKERILEQCAILPLQPHSGERLVSEFKREIAHGVYSRKRLSLSNMQPSFIWVNAAIAKRSEILNELVVCTMSASKPCELSIQLLNSLREILKAACQESLGALFTENNWGHQFALLDKDREKIKASSAYRSFEVQSCQLQVTDVSTLDDNSKIVFFCNIYNILTVHSILSRGYCGTGLHDRANFMKSSKYNINGAIFNLLEIEHNILRSQTASPSFILSHLMSMSEKGPKATYSIQRPIPLISFTLFLACVSSPALTILWDANTVDTELQRAARSYILCHSRIDRTNKTLYLPELFKWYSKDYGTSSKDILQTILQLIGKDNSLYEEICKYVEQHKPNLAYTPFDWKFQLVI